MAEFSEKDRKYMAEALQLAKLGAGRVSPNPMVGAIIVKNGKIISRGWHRFFGGRHAEAYAIDKAGKNSFGSDLYVTLEPCCHYGKTLPCSDAIIKAGIKRVVIAMNDPNRIACGGADQLKKAGIRVETGLMAEEAEKLNEAFIKFVTKGYPFVLMKMAMTLDGKTATAEGRSRWISGKASRRIVQQWRKEFDAVLIGINTLIKDDSRLLAPGRKNKPVRIILDNKALTPLSSRLIKTNKTAPVLIIVSKSAPLERISRLNRTGAEVMVMPGKTVSIKQLMKKLAERGIASILVEGGSEVNWAFLKANMVDNIAFFIAPKIIGGKNAFTPVEGKGFKLKDAMRVREWTVQCTGEDFLIEARVN